MDYTSQETLALFLQNEPSNADVLEKCITWASRAFDTLVGVEAGFFATAGDDPTAKVIAFKDGKLTLPPFVGNLAAVLDSQGSAIPTTDYVLSGSPPAQYLESALGNIRNNYCLPVTVDYFNSGKTYCTTNNAFGSSSFYTVSARWGFASVPADVEFATTMLALKMYRDMDVVNIARTVIEGIKPQDVPPLVQKTADEWKAKLGLNG